MLDFRFTAITGVKKQDSTKIWTERGTDKQTDSFTPIFEPYSMSVHNLYFLERINKNIHQLSENTLILNLNSLCCPNIILVVRKPVFRVSDQVPQKLVCTVTEGG